MSAIDRMIDADLEKEADTAERVRKRIRRGSAALGRLRRQEKVLEELTDEIQSRIMLLEIHLKNLRDRQSAKGE